MHHLRGYKLQKYNFERKADLKDAKMKEFCEKMARKTDREQQNTSNVTRKNILALES